MRARCHTRESEVSQHPLIVSPVLESVIDARHAVLSGEGGLSRCFGCKLSGGEAMRYRGKVDWWIGRGGLVGMLAPIALAPALNSVAMYAVFAGICTLVLRFCFPQSMRRPRLTSSCEQDSGRFVSLHCQITTVKPSTDSTSALALSLDRVLIEYQSGAIMIAPENRIAFMADVQAHTSQLSKRGPDFALPPLIRRTPRGCRAMMSTSAPTRMGFVQPNSRFEGRFRNVNGGSGVGHT